MKKYTFDQDHREEVYDQVIQDYSYIAELSLSGDDKQMIIDDIVDLIIGYQMVVQEAVFIRQRSIELAAGKYDK